VAFEVFFSVEKISIVTSNDMVIVTERKALRGECMLSNYSVACHFLYDMTIDKGVFFYQRGHQEPFHLSQCSGYIHLVY